MHAAAEAETRQAAFQVPVTAIKLSSPRDGLPILEDWKATACNIYGLGFEAWRETVELKGSGLEGQAMGIAGVEVAKGFTRMSILLFGIVWSYVTLKDDWDKAVEEDFKKCLDPIYC